MRAWAGLTCQRFAHECRWKEISSIVDELASKKIHTVGDLMQLTRLQATPLLKKSGLMDGQIEALKSILRTIDDAWSDWESAQINFMKEENTGRGGKRADFAEELAEEVTTDADREGYHLTAEWYADTLPARLGGGPVSGSALRRMRAAATCSSWLLSSPLPLLLSDARRYGRVAHTASSESDKASG
jgi:hypothetical protein